MRARWSPTVASLDPGLPSLLCLASCFQSSTLLISSPGLYMVIVLLMLVNVLIAMFSDTFRRVKDNEKTIWKFQRLELLKVGHTFLFKSLEHVKCYRILGKRSFHEMFKRCTYCTY